MPFAILILVALLVGLAAWLAASSYPAGHRASATGEPATDASAAAAEELVADDGAPSVARADAARPARPGDGDRSGAHARARRRRPRRPPRRRARLPDAFERHARLARPERRRVGRRPRHALVDAPAAARHRSREHARRDRVDRRRRRRVEMLRVPNVWIVPFLLTVVVGEILLVNTVKQLLDRVRPTFNPIAETLGPSFPSGHSATAAALYAGGRARPRAATVAAHAGDARRAALSRSRSVWPAAASCSACTGSPTSSRVSRSAGRGSRCARSRSAAGS